MILSVEPGEKLLPPIEAIETATGRRVHKSCFHRWATLGCRGIKLPVVFFGGVRMTSVEAVHRWISATTAARDGGVSESRTPRQRERDVERAERELQEAGW